MVLMKQSNGRTLLVELESGREVSSLATRGVAQMRGEMPLYWTCMSDWNSTGEGSIDCLVAFDPAHEQPRLVFKSSKASNELPEIWKGVNPVCDVTKPEFSGPFVAAVTHGGYLWLLRRETEEPGTFLKNDPNGFRLVRVGLEGSTAVTIPLRYEVPEAIRKLAITKDQSDYDKALASLDRPVVNIRSLTATSKRTIFRLVGLRQ